MPFHYKPHAPRDPRLQRDGIVSFPVLPRAEALGIAAKYSRCVRDIPELHRFFDALDPYADPAKVVLSPLRDGTIAYPGVLHLPLHINLMHLVYASVVAMGFLGESQTASIAFLSPIWSNKMAPPRVPVEGRHIRMRRFCVTSNSKKPGMALCVYLVLRGEMTVRFEERSFGLLFPPHKTTERGNAFRTVQRVEYPKNVQELKTVTVPAGHMVVYHASLGTQPAFDTRPETLQAVGCLITGSFTPLPEAAHHTERAYVRRLRNKCAAQGLCGECSLRVVSKATANNILHERKPSVTAMTFVEKIFGTTDFIGRPKPIDKDGIADDRHYPRPDTEGLPKEAYDYFAWHKIPSPQDILAHCKTWMAKV